MAEEFLPGCTRPAIKKDKSVPTNESDLKIERGEPNNMIKVGSKAPEFTASAYFQNKFMNINLSDYLGKWVLLCFYPGDFTFV